jgi:glycosyltransferase involved in cell wall biosynthesis
LAKILHICGLDSFVSAIQPLLESLIQQGHEVHCACTDTGIFAELDSMGIRMIRMPVVRKLVAPSNIKTIYGLHRLIRKEKYDIVHVHNPIASMLGRVAARLAGCKEIIYTSHGFYFHDQMPPMKYHLYYQIEKWLTRICVNRLFLVSREDYEVCLKGKFKKPQALHHVSNGVELGLRFNPSSVSLEEIQRMKNELGFNVGDKIIVYVGRLVQEKGVLELLEAFTRLKSMHPQAKLLLIGETHDSERDRSLRELQPQSPRADVHFLGFRSDIPLLLAMCDVFVLPSHREGMPLSILEAMAMAKPIIATDIRGCREEVAHGRNGFLVPVRDAGALFERLNDLLCDDTLRKTFGAESRRIAVLSFNIEWIVQQQLEIYSTILAQSSPQSALNFPSYHS